MKPLWSSFVITEIDIFFWSAGKTKTRCDRGKKDVSGLSDFLWGGVWYGGDGGGGVHVTKTINPATQAWHWIKHYLMRTSLLSWNKCSYLGKDDTLSSGVGEWGRWRKREREYNRIEVYSGGKLTFKSTDRWVLETWDWLSKVDLFRWATRRGVCAHVHGARACCDAGKREWGNTVKWGWGAQWETTDNNQMISIILRFSSYWKQWKSSS